MSYNISRWMTKRLENLVIPLDALFETTSGWAPELPILKDWKDGITLEIRIAEDGFIVGKLLEENRVAVQEIQCSGGGSGSFFHEVLRPALLLSSGVLEAVQLWEGGDTINRLLVKEGRVRYERIRL